MPTYAPGFINVHSQSLGGQVSLSINHIIGISPTVTHRNNQTECTIYIDSGVDPVLVDITRDDVLQAITEASGTDRAGTAAQIDSIAATIQANNQALVAAIRTNQQQ
jgi:hypothetical protein